MVDTKDIYWLAGLLEGEGCFSVKGGGRTDSPYIQLWMTDKDVVEKAHKLLGATTKIRQITRNGWKTAYYFRVGKDLGIGWMMTLYALLGERRRAKIREIIQLWLPTRTMCGAH